MASRSEVTRLIDDEEDLCKLKSLQLMSLTRQAKSDGDGESEDWETAIIDQLLRSKEWNQLVKQSTTIPVQNARLLTATDRINNIKSKWIVDGTKRVLLFDKDQNIETIRRAGNTFKDAKFPAGPGIIGSESRLDQMRRESTWLSCKVNEIRF